MAAADPMRRLASLSAAAVERCGLDFSGLTVVTEAATGAYVVTPVLAALAGADRVVAVGRDSRYGSFDEVKAQTEHLAVLAGVGGRIELVNGKSRQVIAAGDVVTNSGHLRSLDRETISWMKPTAVIPLMYEAWEFRPGDVDLDACAERGILVAGTNECHEAVDVFSYLPVMAIRALLNADLPVYRNRIVVLCDNSFGPYLERGLSGFGAEVIMSPTVDSVPAHVANVDAVLVSLHPRATPVLPAADVEAIAARWPGVLVCQFWGDIDRAACHRHGLPVIPPLEPKPGHMAILPSDAGPDSVVRLQSGGLKVGEVLSRHRRGAATTADLAFVQFLEPAHAGAHGS